jgi:nucleoside phosphorylase
MIDLKRKPVPMIITPTPQEFDAVKRGLKEHSLSRIDELNVLKCGVGEENAKKFCANLDSKQISILILMGWAGGLTHNLAAGDVIIAEKALHEGQTPLQCNPLPFHQDHRGNILTASKALTLPSEKENALRSGAAAVEMEAYPMAAWAAQHEIPFIHARVILDAWDEPLPDFGTAMDISGKVQIAQIIKQICRQPHLAVDLWWLMKRIRAIDPILASLAAKTAEFLSQSG